MHVLEPVYVENGRYYNSRVVLLFFLRGKEKRSEGDQSVIGDIPIRSSPKHYCDHFFT